MKKLSTQITESFNVNEEKIDFHGVKFDKKISDAVKKKYTTKQLMNDAVYYSAADYVQTLDKSISQRDAEAVVGYCIMNESKVNEAQKFNKVDMGSNLKKSNFGDKITDIKTLYEDDELIIHEPGMNEWVGPVEFKGIVKKEAKLEMANDGHDMSISEEELIDEIKNGYVFEYSRS